MIKVISWNVNGLQQRKNEVSTLIAQVKPDVILLQETWLKPHMNYEVPGYHVYRTDRVGKRRGGVATLVLSTITQEEANIENNNIETSTVKLVNGEKDVHITSAYFPGRSTRKADIFRMAELKPNALIAGDFNAKNELWGNNKTDQLGTYIEKFCVEKGYTLHIPNAPTRRSYKTNEPDSTIDYAITSDNNNDVEIEVLDTGTTSDHLPLLITVDFAKIEKRQDDIKISTNWDKVADELNNRPWTITGDPDYDIEHFTASIQSATMNNSKGIKMRDKRHILLPKEIQRKMEEKRKAVKEYYKYKTKQNKLRMKRLKSEFDRMFREREREKTIDEMKKLNDPALRWMILKKSRPQPPPIPSL